MTTSHEGPPQRLPPLDATPEVLPERIAALDRPITPSNSALQRPTSGKVKLAPLTNTATTSSSEEGAQSSEKDVVAQTPVADEGDAVGELHDNFPTPSQSAGGASRLAARRYSALPDATPPPPPNKLVPEGYVPVSAAEVMAMADFSEATAMFRPWPNMMLSQRTGNGGLHISSVIATKKIVPIYLGGNAEDTCEERDYLVNRAIPELQETLRARNVPVKLYVVDLRWRKEDLDDPQRVTHAPRVSMELVDYCRPFFIGILGEKYGWCPEYEHYGLDPLNPRFGWIKDFPDGRSLNELEMFFATCETQNAYGSSVRPSAFFYDRMIPATEAAERLQAIMNIGVLNDAKCMLNLKLTLIRRGYPIRRFVRTESARAADIAKFGEMVKEDITRGIDEMFPPIGGDPTPLHAQRETHFHVVETHTQTFVGREDILRTMWRFVDSEGKGRILAISGPPGGGKGALLSRFASVLTERGTGEFRCLPHFVGRSPGSSSVATLLLRLCEEIADIFNLPDKRFPSDFAELVKGEHLRKTMSRAMLQGICRRLVIIIDNVSGLDSADDLEAHRMKWLPVDVPDGVRVIVSATRVPSPATQLLAATGSATGPGNALSRKVSVDRKASDRKISMGERKAPAHVDRKVSTNTRPEDASRKDTTKSVSDAAGGPKIRLDCLASLSSQFGDLATIHELPPLAPEEGREMADSILHEYGHWVDDSLVGSIVAKAEGCLPLYIKVACEMLVMNMVGCTKPMSEFSAIERMEPTIGGLLQQLLGDLETAFGMDLVREALCMIVCSRVGLTRDELRQLLCGIPDTPSPHASNSDVSASERLSSASRALLNGKVSNVDWHRFYVAVSPFLRTTPVSEDGDELLNLIHPLFAHAVRTRYLSSCPRMCESFAAGDLCVHLALHADVVNHEAYDAHTHAKLAAYFSLVVARSAGKASAMKHKASIVGRSESFNDDEDDEDSTPARKESVSRKESSSRKESQPQGPSSDGSLTFAGASPRVLSSLGYHKIHAREWVGIHNTLTNIEYLESRCESGDIVAISEDLQLALRVWPAEVEETKRSRLSEYVRFFRYYLGAYKKGKKGNFSKSAFRKSAKGFFPPGFE